MTRAGEIIERSREELVFAYRESSLDELVILGREVRTGAGRSRGIDQADAKAVDRQEGRASRWAIKAPAASSRIRAA